MKFEELWVRWRQGFRKLRKPGRKGKSLSLFFSPLLTHVFHHASFLGDPCLLPLFPRLVSRTPHSPHPSTRPHAATRLHLPLLQDTRVLLLPWSQALLDLLHLLGWREGTEQGWAAGWWRPENETFCCRHPHRLSCGSDTYFCWEGLVLGPLLLPHSLAPALAATSREHESFMSRRRRLAQAKRSLPDTESNR